MQDEGVGVRVVEAMRAALLPPGVDLLDGGTAGLSLLELMEGYDRVIVVDAVQAGAEPGAIFRYRPEDRAAMPNVRLTSFHQVGLMDVLQLAESVGQRPEVVIIGVQPASLDWGTEPTPQLQDAVPRVIEFVLREIRGRGTPEEDG
ncbi:MAG: HyaD/HybD family hydrogenase maturation endopeptidase [Chloroflexi bacterium]|nr:HyaD/HybD family hydrogenase maturation endopeptidase [Chloroflexota bacterium]